MYFCQGYIVIIIIVIICNVAFRQTDESGESNEPNTVTSREKLCKA